MCSLLPGTPSFTFADMTRVLFGGDEGSISTAYRMHQCLLDPLLNEDAEKNVGYTAWLRSVPLTITTFPVSAPTVGPMSDPYLTMPGMV